MKTYIYPTLALGEAAVKAARARYPLGTSNKLSGDPTHKLDTFKDQLPKGTPLNGVVRQAYAAANRGKVAGNCGELAAAAFEFLKAKNVRPVELMCLAAPGDHVFVVMNRDASTPISDFQRWNPGTIVVDPWANFACKASDYHKRFAAKMRQWSSEGKDIWMIKQDVLKTSPTIVPPANYGAEKRGFYNALNWESAILLHSKMYLPQYTGSCREDVADHYNLYVFNDYATFETYDKGSRKRHLENRGMEPSPYSGSDNAFASRIKPLHLKHDRDALCFSFKKDARDTPSRIQDDGHASRHGFERCAKQMNEVIFGCQISTKHTFTYNRSDLLKNVLQFVEKHPERVM